MIVKTIELTYELGQVFHLYTIGDEHFGTKFCEEEAVDAQFGAIRKDPNGLWVGMGDKGEFITPTDPRWNQDGIADWLDPNNVGPNQRDRYCDVAAPVRDKCLGLLTGNHETKMKQKGHYDAQTEICTAMGVPNLGYSCFIRLSFKYAHGNRRAGFVCHFRHGSGNATKKTGKLKKLQDVMAVVDADIYAIGHMHDIITDIKPYLTLGNDNKLHNREAVGAVTGCYFNTYGEGVDPSYGEEKGYDPNTIGCAVFKIDPSKHQVRITEAYA